MALGKLGARGGFGVMGAGRRGPLWTPAQLGNSLVAYLDPMDRAPTLNASSIASLANASFTSGGSAWDLTQVTTGSQPIYSSSSFNGYPGVTTDGIAHTMATTSTAISQTFTRISLVSPLTFNSSHILNSVASSPNTPLILSAVSTVQMYAGAFGPNAVGLNLNGYYCIIESYSGASSVLDVNGSVSSADAGTQGINGLSISPPGNYTNMRYATIAIISRALTSSEKAKCRGYMVWRRRLSSVLPSNDPYKNRPPYVSDP